MQHVAAAQKALEEGLQDVFHFVLSLRKTEVSARRPR
jgi:hypothetical protein